MPSGKAADSEVTWLRFSFRGFVLTSLPWPVWLGVPDAEPLGPGATWPAAQGSLGKQAEDGRHKRDTARDGPWNQPKGKYSKLVWWTWP